MDILTAARRLLARISRTPPRQDPVALLRRAAASEAGGEYAWIDSTVCTLGRLHRELYGPGSARRIRRAGGWSHGPRAACMMDLTSTGLSYAALKGLEMASLTVPPDAPRGSAVSAMRALAARIEETRKHETQEA